MTVNYNILQENFNFRIIKDVFKKEHIRQIKKSFEEKKKNAQKCKFCYYILCVKFTHR